MQIEVHCNTCNTWDVVTVYSSNTIADIKCKANHSEFNMRMWCDKTNKVYDDDDVVSSINLQPPTRLIMNQNLKYTVVNGRTSYVHKYNCRDKRLYEQSLMVEDLKVATWLPTRSLTTWLPTRSLTTWLTRLHSRETRLMVACLEDLEVAQKVIKIIALYFA